VKEAAKNNLKEGMLIVEEWLLIEYAVGTIPVNSETVVEAITSLDWDLPKTESGSQIACPQFGGRLQKKGRKPEAN